jgi:adenylate kinase family enzyme
VSETRSSASLAIGPKISVVGDSCSGKTTLAAALAECLGVRHVEIDALSWQPNWTPTPDDLLLQRIHEAVAEPSWAIDGNYGRIVRPIVWGAADTVVWLDFPLRVTLPRTLARSWRRWRTRELLWGTNRERFWEHLLPWDRSLIWWTLKSHFRRRRAYEAAMSGPETEGTTFIRLRSPAEVGLFLERVRLAVPAWGPAPTA